MRETDLASLSELTAEELIRRGEKMVALGRDLLGVAARLDGSPVPVQPIYVKRLEPEEEELPASQLPRDERSVGRQGNVVTLQSALKKAQLMQEFDCDAFAEALGLTGPATMRWLSKLVQSNNVVREGLTFRCITKPSLHEWVLAHTEDVWHYDDLQEATGLSGEDLGVEIRKLLDKQIITAIGDGADSMYGYVPADVLAGPTEHETLPPPERRLGGDLAPSHRGEAIRIRTERKNRRARSTPGQAQKIKNQEAAWQRQQEAKEERRRKNLGMADKKRAPGGGSAKRGTK